MVDQVIKGTGNSRYLKSSISASATWSDFLTMLRNGTLPIDLNGTNSAGITTTGTALNKANLLSDATANKVYQATGTTPSTPNLALNYLADAVKAGAKIQTGSYVGTGTYGASNPCSLTFEFEPKFVCIASWSYILFLVQGSGSAFWTTYGGSTGTDNAIWSGNTVQWYNYANEYYQLNIKDTTYYYCAFG